MKIWTYVADRYTPYLCVIGDDAEPEDSQKFVSLEDHEKAVEKEIRRFAEQVASELDKAAEDWRIACQPKTAGALQGFATALRGRLILTGPQRSSSSSPEE